MLNILGFDEFYTAVSNRKGYWIADTHEDHDRYWGQSDDGTL